MKGKAEALEPRYNTLQTELTLQEVKVANYLQEAVKIHGSPSSLEARVTKMKGSLKNVEKQYKVASDSVEKKGRQVEDLTNFCNS